MSHMERMNCSLKEEVPVEYSDCKHRAILIRIFRPQITNSDSDNPSFEEVLKLNPKLNRKVADLIMTLLILLS
uniref:NR LBD domain-containing protein n=2 Tax=Rhabditophanes sp. KR3021 TaxID=114890 RepID=A0AC35TU46_9BILA